MTLLSGLFFFCSFLGQTKASGPQEEDEFALQRDAMVEAQIVARGIKEARLLLAMRKVKRHLFLPEGMKLYAYQDSALPIEERQTISQPYIVALMTKLAHVTPQSRILEIGTGSGYQTAILAELCQKVYSMEIKKPLADSARQRLNGLGYKNIEVRHGDGYKGWPEAAPFDAILVTAAASEIPEELIKELKIGGRLIIPLGDLSQELYVVTKNTDGSIEKESIIPVRFVPMVKKINTN